MSLITIALQKIHYKTGIFFSTLVVTSKTFAFGSDKFGTGDLDDLPNPGNGDLRVAVLNLIKTVLSYLALIAVVYIIYAGIRLMVSRGNEEAVSEGRKTIIYVLVGLIVIIFARFLVSIATDIILTGVTAG
jgi:hypothetical protein